MFKISFYRGIKAGVNNFFRNGWLSLATTSVIALALFIVTFLLSLIFIANYLLKEVQNKIDVSVYFTSETSEEKVFEVKKELELMAEIKEVHYVSEDAALGLLKEKYQNNEIIMNSLRELKENPLEASLSIKVYDSGKYELIENMLVAGKYKSYVSKMDFSDHKKEIERLNGIIYSIRKVGAVVVIVLMLVAILVTFNSIRLTIYTYRTEVEIMRLVGANNWFIRLPFIVEGILYGTSAALLTVIIFYPLAGYLVPFFIRSGVSMDLAGFLGQSFVYILGIQIFSGVVLGAASSLIAIRRYLKV